MAVGLSPEQIAQLKKMPGINQNLVSAYEKGGQNLTTVEKEAVKTADTSKERLAEIASQSFVTPENKAAVQKVIPSQTVTATPTTKTSTKSQSLINVPTKDKVSGMMAFSSALQQAVNLGRQQRQSAELDFLGGVIPPGSVSAGQFTGLLASLNRASTQFTQPLVESAIGFAQDEQKAIQDEQNSIRDLALAAVEAGGSQETVNAILAAGNIDSAISVAAGTLNTGSKMVVEKVGSNLVQYDPADPENTTQVLFSADGVSSSGASSGGATTRTPSVSGTTDFLKLSTNDLLVQAKKMFAPEFANQVINDLTNEQLKLFLNDYTEKTNQSAMSIPPESFYQEWRASAGLDTTETDTGSGGITNRFR